MSVCTYNIRHDLSKNSSGVIFPPGGIWVYNGYSSSSSTGPFTDTPTTPLVPYSEGDEIPLGDNFNINTDAKSPGFYSFTYNYTGGSDDLTIQILADSSCAGDNLSISYSDTDVTTYDLSTFLPGTNCPSPTTGGTWEDLDGAGAAFSAPNLTPNGMTPGTYRFKYSLQESGFNTTDCLDCVLEATITVTINDAFEITSITTSDSTCTYSIDIQHPGTSTSGDIQITISNDDMSPTLSYDTIVTSTCESSNVLEESVSKNYYPYYTTIQNNNSLQDGGTLEYITLTSSTSGSIQVPLAPSGTYAATLTGAGGNVSASNLVYYSYSPSIFEQAIKKVIINYLDSQGYTDGTDYKLGFVSVLSGTATIGFRSKHNPSTEWIGIERSVATLEYKVSKPTAPSTASTDGYLIPDISVLETYNEYPCPHNSTKLKYTTDPIVAADYITVASFDYDSIPLSVATISTSLNSADSNISQACTGKTLTVNTINCLGTTTYSWSSGETSSSITKKVGSGTYSVTCDCDNPVSSDSSSITI